MSSLLLREALTYYITDTYAIIDTSFPLYICFVQDVHLVSMMQNVLNFGISKQANEVSVQKHANEAFRLQFTQSIQDHSVHACNTCYTLHACFSYY